MLGQVLELLRIVAIGPVFRLLLLGVSWNFVIIVPKGGERVHPCRCGATCQHLKALADFMRQISRTNRSARPIRARCSVRPLQNRTETLRRVQSIQALLSSATCLASLV